MTGLAFCVLLQAAVVGADGLPYSEAFKLAEANEQPLVVLVGADWCPGCVTMKRSTIPGLLRRGALRNVQFTTVNTDDEPALAQRLMRGNSIPQLIVFARTEQGWRREQLTGPRTESEVASLVHRAVETQSKSTKVASDLR